MACRLYRNVVNLAIYTGCAASGNTNVTLLVPTGWELVSILNFTDPSGRSKIGPVPFAAVFHQPQERQLVSVQVPGRPAGRPGSCAMEVVNKMGVGTCGACGNIGGSTGRVGMKGALRLRECA